jgi:HipA-like C-terminal domain
MRNVRDAGNDIVRIGRGRATRYGWRQLWPTLEASRFPLFRVTEQGTAQSAGELFTLSARQTVWMPSGLVSNGLPIELADARPSGFLGRHFAAMHADLRLPARVSDWSDHHILSAMSRRGEDTPGNLLIGDETFARWQALEPAAGTRADYPALAEATIEGHPPGSSAGGERPKFGVMVDGRHMLVKFARRGGAGDATARRWCDLLVLEALALHVVASRGIPAARTHIVDTPTHCFLESERFDRVGARGRLAVVSLAAIHDDPADSWARAAARLRDAGQIGDEDARRLRWLDAFGAFIANTDRHQYNVVFFAGDRIARLAPAFDQVSMLYAPAADGQAPSRALTVPYATADTLDVWDEARAAAREFWRLAADDHRVSDDLRVVCAGNAKALA